MIEFIVGTLYGIVVMQIVDSWMSRDRLRTIGELEELREANEELRKAIEEKMERDEVSRPQENATQVDPERHS